MIEMDMPKIEVEESEDQSYVEEYSCPRSPVRRRRE